MFRRFIYFVSFVLCATAHADPALCAKGACTARISRLYLRVDGTLLIGTTGDESQLSCHAVSNIYITLPAGAPGFDMIYSGLLAYQLAGDPVTLRILEGSNNCELTYAVFEKKY